uniref:DDB1- and CUL4-associated factor 13 n=1 Tax=Strigamia maritima TaxID=126957 RepID=T1JP66_STRMM
MKIKVLCRNPDDYLRETKADIHKVHRNYDPVLHPFEAGREYVRARNAVKLQNLFSKPFIGSLDGHKDGIECLTKHPTQLTCMLSGCCDGEVRVWDLAEKVCKRVIQAHTGFVREICFPSDGGYFLTTGDDKTIKQWPIEVPEDGDDVPSNTIIAKTMLTGMSHHWQKPMFVTCGEKIDLWEESRSVPLRSISWGVDTHCSVRFNPIETNLLASCVSNRSIVLYDIRRELPVRKVIMSLKSNKICWNPMEAFVFTVANEDYNLYSFDLRNLRRPINIHRDHVSAVIDVDYAPTGKEFVSGSYDKTIRIFSSDKGHSRDIYHTKRMQRLKCVSWTRDNTYILSGSDEMSIRLWKARASEKLGLLHPREKVVSDYNEKLKEKYAHHPEISRIARHRHVPKHIYNAKKEMHVIRQKAARKQANRRAHSKPGSVPFTSTLHPTIVEEQE